MSNQTAIEYVNTHFTKAKGFHLTNVEVRGVKYIKVHYDYENVETTKALLDFFCNYQLELGKFNGYFLVNDQLITPRTPRAEDKDTLEMLKKFADEMYSTSVNVSTAGNVITVSNENNSSVSLTKKGSQTVIHLTAKGKVYFDNIIIQGYREEHYLLVNGLRFIYRVLRDNLEEIEQRRFNELQMASITKTTKALAKALTVKTTKS